MSQKKNYSSEFKFKVALEAVKGDRTIAELISLYKVPKSVIHKWKRQFLENGSSIFGAANQKKQDDNEDVEKLLVTIGKLKVENDFLQKAFKTIK